MKHPKIDMPPAPIGRPSEYRPEFCDMLIAHFNEGLSFNSFAGVIGVCIDTIYRWAKEFPEFSDAKARGRAIQLLWDEKLLNKGAEGKQRGYNAAAHKWKMANVHKWTERQEVTSKPPSNMTEEELLREARELVQELESKSKED